MFDSLRIRSKLAVAILIPLVALLASSSLAITSANRRSNDAAEVVASADAVNAQVDLVTAALGPSGILTALNNERALEAIVLLGLDPALLGQTQDEVAVRAATDRAVEQFRAAIADKPPTVRDNYERAIDVLGRLPELRNATDASTVRNMDNVLAASAIFDSYTTLVQAVFDANTRSADLVDNAGLRNGVRFLDELTRYSDSLTVAERVVGGAIAFNQVENLTQHLPSLVDATAATREMARLRTEMERNEDPFYAGLARELFATPSLNDMVTMLDGAIDGQPVTIEKLIGSNAADVLGTFNEAVAETAEHLQADVNAVRAVADLEASDAATEARLVTLFTAAVLILAGAVTIVASQSITRPLSRLVGAAEEMATAELPSAVRQILDTPAGEDVQLPDTTEIEGRGGVEIAEVADALNTVQRSAVGLAVEQAALRRNIADAFVNLGRRNQNLMNRLIQNITEMEKRESDPDELRELFSLDHLATRMRRNAESLVVLAGGESRRRWSAPVPVLQVVRGALGEVEHYERAEIVSLDDAWVTGSTVVEVTHLVAELLENAITFSPPGRPVQIRGTATGDGYELAVIDHGVGMTPEDLAVANARVSGTESFTVAPSRYLGHYVIGRQANRLGVGVVLADTFGGGLTATIDLASVLADPASVPASAKTSTGHEVTEPPTAPVYAMPPASAPTGPSPDQSVTKPAPVHELRPEPEVFPAWAVRAPEPQPEARPEDDADQQPEPATAMAASTPAPAVETTTSGYRKRVRGAHIPTTEVVTARDEQAPARQPVGAEGMRSVLSSVQAGMVRGSAEAQVDQSDDDTDARDES